jgi:hypothetical protein
MFTCDMRPIIPCLKRISDLLISRDLRRSAFAAGQGQVPSATRGSVISLNLTAEGSFHH